MNKNVVSLPTYVEKQTHRQPHTWNFIASIGLRESCNVCCYMCN
jgi:hypothetical protein